MNVLEIIKEYLIQNGYDGLYNTAGECACLVEDLAPCSESCLDCEPGYRGPCLCGGDHDFDLTSGRPTTTLVGSPGHSSQTMSAEVTAHRAGL